MDTKTYAVVDLETTGHSSIKGDRIIQIAIVFIKNEEIGEKYVRFVNPDQKIPAFIRQLTNISDEDVKDAPYFDEIAAEVAKLLEGTIFVAHNTDFDLSFLQSEFKRCGIAEWFGREMDTVELSKVLFPTASSYRLQDIAEELGIPLAAAHRADDDAEATAHLFLACNRKLEMLPEDTLNLLHRRSFYLKSDLSTLFHESLKQSRKNRPIDISSFRGIPYRKIKVLEDRNFEPLDYPVADDLKVVLLEKGFPEFERREPQFRFMDTVWKTFDEQSEVVVEVPTGIGKTMAYLLPAAIRSIETGKPVVISTFTNHLVDKIKGDELDRLRLILGTKIHAVVLKGMEQYISLGKFEELLRIADESYDETLTIMQILIWLTETVTGDLEELNVSGGGQLFVDRIRKRSNIIPADEQEADYHSILMLKSIHSNLIITNHSMLLADLNREQKLFTSLGGLVVDEVHQLTHIATRVNEKVFSFTNWKYTMGQIGSDAEGQLLQQIDALNHRLSSTSTHIKRRLDASFAIFTDVFDKAVGVMAFYNLPTKERKRDNRVVYSLSGIKSMQSYFENVVSAMSDYVDNANALTNSLLIHQDNMTPNEQALLSEWIYWIREIKIKAGEWIEIFLEDDPENYIVWVEKDKRSLPGSLTVSKYPLDGSTVVRKFINRMKDEQTGIVWTSGTVSIKGNARFIPNQLGINPQVPLLTFDAPEHFYEGAEIYIVDDMPGIQQVSQSDYVEAVADAVIQTTMATGGRLFVLFTSLDMLRKTHDLIVESEQLNEYALFAQGITSGSRMKLLKSFRQFDNSVLFGTNSFWEGVDVPGDALSAIIVVRLPFSSPDNPVFKAKSAKLTAQGLNSFAEFALPEAVMRLRQGFGRLIRSSADKGFFIVLDRRIETKSYGHQFIESLPDVPVKKVSLQVMVKELEDCYNIME
ncbi:ATP-dependent DNA helicase DinG [Sporosarcina siberiensis]|uniref:3'-5' exonuclease DinG n=1 Tax=Sporosarcina siberiensis TaxID=1365606 RepID=A0ABW4SGZ8_9BACL